MEGSKRNGIYTSATDEGRPEAVDHGGLRYAVALALFAFASPALGAERGAARVVTQDEILQAMQQATGYSLTATTNGPRFQSEVILRLAAAAAARDPARQPLFIGHREWFEAYLQRTREACAALVA